MNLTAKIFADCNVEIALVTEGRTPRIFNNIMRYTGCQIVSHYFHCVVQAFKRTVAMILYYATQIILPRYGVYGNRHGSMNNEQRQEFAFCVYKAETSSIQCSETDRSTG